MSSMFTPPRRRSPLRVSTSAASRRSSLSPFWSESSRFRASSLTGPTVRGLPRGALMEAPSFGRATSFNATPPPQNSPADQTAIQLLYDTYGRDLVDRFASMDRTQLSLQRDHCERIEDRANNELEEIKMKIDECVKSRMKSELLLQETYQQRDDEIRAALAEINARFKSKTASLESEIKLTQATAEHLEEKMEKVEKSLLDNEANDNFAEYLHFGSVNGVNGPPKPYQVDDIRTVWDDLKCPDKAAVRRLQKDEVVSKLRRCENLGLAGNDVLRERFKGTDFKEKYGEHPNIDSRKSVSHEGVRVYFTVSQLQDRLIDYLCYPDDGPDENEDPIFAAEMKAIKAMEEEARMSARKRRASRGTPSNGEPSAKKAHILQT